MKVFLLVLGCLILLAAPAQPPEEQHFTRLTTAAGLSGNEITGLGQDARGYLWIATTAGINRFDGNRFRPYHGSDDTATPASEELSDAVWLDSDRLAFYSASGLHIINTRTGKTRNLFVPYKKQQYLYKFNTVHGARASAAGDIYLLTRSGFYHFRNDSLLMRFDYYREEELNNTHFHFGGSLFDFDASRLLIVSAEGLFIYHKEKRSLKRLDAEASPFLAELSYQRFRSLLFLQPAPGQFFILQQDSDSLVHLNTITGKKTVSRLPFRPPALEFHYRSRLFAINDTTFYITAHSTGMYRVHLHPQRGKVRWDPQKYFSSYLCRAVMQDHEGRLWVGTHRGLFRQNLHAPAVEVAALPPGWEDAFPSLRLTDMVLAGEKLYAGTTGGAGLLIFDRKTLQWEARISIHESDRQYNQVVALAAAGKRGLLVGTYGQLMLMDWKRKKFRPLQHYNSVGWINDLHEDHAGNIWIAGSDNIALYKPSGGTLNLVPVQKHLLNLPVYFSEDRAHFIWMASHGLARYNMQQKAFDHFVDSFPFIKMPDRQVGELVFDRQDHLWFASNNNGLIRYDKKKRTFAHFTSRNGLPDNNIMALLIAGDRLWIACTSGLAALHLQTGEIISFGPQDGFPDAPLLKSCRFYFDSTAGHIYIGFATALVRFSPQSLLQKKNPPQTFIESVVTGGRRLYYLPGEKLETSWKEKELRINMGSINLGGGGPQRYAYRVVEDENTPWTDMGFQSSFSIASLPGGTHRIQVKTYAVNNAWPPQVAELQLTVTPPFWEGTAFRIAVAAVLLALLYWFIRWRIGIARKKEMVKTQLEKLKADNYKNQFELEQISHYFSSSLADKHTEEEVLWDVAQNLIGRMGYEDCVLYGWNKEHTKMVQKAAHGPKGSPGIMEEDGFEVVPGQGIVGHVMLTKEPVLVKDTRVDPRYRVDDAFRLSEITVPVLHNGELLGIIDSEHHRLGYFNERDIKILTTIATLIGNKLKQIESERTLEVKKKELASINEQLAEARLSAMQAQMNPHFVFNALNSIKRMILDEDNEMASRYLSKFALMIRMTLEHSKSIFVTLDENIEYISNYLAMEQLRFGDTFSWTITVDEALDEEETVLPSMMIQPLVENAIWHGLLQSEKEKVVNISFTREGEKVICTVTDNGIGLQRSAMMKLRQRPMHRSAGLENLKKRIRIINEKFDTDCTLQVADLEEPQLGRQGTKAVLALNVINANYKL